MLLEQYIMYLQSSENKKEFDKNIEIPDPRDLQDRFNQLERKREAKFTKELGYNLFRLPCSSSQEGERGKREMLNQCLGFLEKQTRQMIYDGRISVNTERRFQLSGSLSK